MKNKTIADLRSQRQLSREQMKSVTAGRPAPPPECSGCVCNYGSVYLREGSCYCDGGFALPCAG